MRALLLWLLMLALPVYGASGTSLRMLGPAHWHSAPAAVVSQDDDWLQPAIRLVQQVAQRVKTLRDEAHVRAHALGARHEHQGLQRHWHEAADGSVHSVGSADPAVADLVAGAAVGSATLVLAAPVASLLVVDVAANGRWPAAPVPVWADAESVSTSPPPRR